MPTTRSSPEGDAPALELTSRRRLTPTELFIVGLLAVAPFTAFAYKRLRGQSPWLLVGLATIVGWGLAVALLREYSHRESLTLTPDRLTWRRGRDRIEAARADVVRVERTRVSGGGHALRLVVRDDDEESGNDELDYLILARAPAPEQQQVLATLERWRRDGTLRA